MTFEICVTIKDIPDAVDGEITLTLSVQDAVELRDKLETVLGAHVCDIL